MKKFSIKKPNLIANVGNFLPVWLFSKINAQGPPKPWPLLCGSVRLESCCPAILLPEVAHRTAIALMVG